MDIAVVSTVFTAGHKLTCVINVRTEWWWVVLLRLVFGWLEQLITVGVKPSPYGNLITIDTCAPKFLTIKNKRNPKITLVFYKV